MRKLFTLILSVIFVFAAFAQKPEGVIKKTTVKPVIDGVKDAGGVWDAANVYNIDKPYTGETPTLGAEGETNWRALYDEDGIYILVTVTDNVFVPRFMGTGAGYLYDHPEVYFDVNFLLEDAGGPLTDGNGGGNGHYQIAPDILEDLLEGKPTTRSDGVVYAFKADDPNYVAEYYVPFSKLKTKDGGPADISSPLGFDITICDNDVKDTPNSPVRHRAVWANVGTQGESWNNMDDAGLITFEGAEAAILVDEITLTGGNITVDNQKLQIGAEILPEDATIKTVKWIIKKSDGSTARAKISSTGVITPALNEELIVQATSLDGFILSNEVTVSITGQIATLFELSYITNGDFNNTLADGVPVDWGGFADGTANVVNGVLNFGPTEVLANPWDYKMLQITQVPYALKDLDYIISFKAWADEPRTMPLVIEDSYAQSWASYGTSTDANFNDKTWTIELTTTPTVYTLHVNFGIMKSTCVQNFNFQVGTATPKIYLDSIYMVSEADLKLIPENVILNGDFAQVESDGQGTNWTGGWTDASPKHKVVDGVSVHTPLATADVWRYQFSQNALTAKPNVPYVFKFKAWAAANRTFTVDFEDTEANGYNRYGATKDPRSSNGRSEWTFDITTEPTWYTFDVTFDQIKETTDQKVQFMLGTSDIVTYIDSVYLLAESVSGENVDVENIVLTGGIITTDNGTLQIGAQIIPENATNKKIKWSVAPAEGSAGRATISDTGLLSALLNGKVTVTAKSADDFVISTVDVDISGQVVTESDVNIVKNGKFDLLNADGVTATYWEGWTDASPAHTIVDGVSIHTPIAGTTDTWRYQFIQKNLTGLPNIDYVVNFTAWADVARSINVDFEDAPNGNARYGASTNPEATGGGLIGRSDWIVNITTEPKKYTLNVNFDQILPNTVQQISFFLGNFASESTVYIDNVSVISVADMALLPTSIAQNSLESFKVYPNPAVNKLYIDLSTPNATVAIYNSLGIKMEETIVNGTHHEFDVSRYTKGLYFVKANNSVVKFIK